MLTTALVLLNMIPFIACMLTVCLFCSHVLIFHMLYAFAYYIISSTMMPTLTCLCAFDVQLLVYIHIHIRLQVYF